MISRRSIVSGRGQQHTLEAFTLELGFAPKSSFHTIFKKVREKRPYSLLHLSGTTFVVPLHKFYLMYSADIQKATRQFLPADFQLTTWESLEPYFLQLASRELPDMSSLQQWLHDLSELEAAVSEEACWRQIRMTCDTENPALEEAYNYYCLEISPKIQPFADQLNRKLIEHPLTPELEKQGYHTYLRSIRKNIELFREQNIPIQAALAVQQQQFGVITGKLSVQLNGQEYTMQQAAKFLEHPDRTQREAAYRAMQEKRLEVRNELNQLMDELLVKRQQEAQNAGFDNYRDYRFKELGRFDYGPEACYDFQEAVKTEVVPLVRQLHKAKKAKLGLDVLRPWDTDAELPGTTPLHPFQTADELLDKSIEAFTRLRPFFGDCLRRMKSMQHLDLETRKGKAPGGYNCPLAESGAPFIFMHAAGTMNDVVTMVHEGGHAVHSFLAHPLPLTGFKEYPMEIAEVASMAMELFSAKHWDVFFPNRADYVRARRQHLERIITIFPWIALIDAFQHWMYTNPNHTAEARSEAWVSLAKSFSDGVVDYSGLETFRANQWQKQLHLFEVPFYYIEYGIAQLGAIGLWMQFEQDPEAALDRYCAALQLGGTRTLPELYAAAGLPFDFSTARIRELMEFVQQEMEKLT